MRRIQCIVVSVPEEYFCEDKIEVLSVKGLEKHRWMRPKVEAICHLQVYVTLSNLRYQRNIVMPDCEALKASFIQFQRASCWSGIGLKFNAVSHTCFFAKLVIVCRNGALIVNPFERRSMTTTWALWFAPTASANIRKPTRILVSWDLGPEPNVHKKVQGSRGRCRSGPCWTLRYAISDFSWPVGWPVTVQAASREIQMKTGSFSRKINLMAK